MDLADYNIMFSHIEDKNVLADTISSLKTLNMYKIKTIQEHENTSSQ